MAPPHHPHLPPDHDIRRTALSESIRNGLWFIPGSMVLGVSLLGWAGWRTAAGAFGTLLYLGYGLAFMLAGRPELLQSGGWLHAKIALVLGLSGFHGFLAGPES